MPLCSADRTQKQRYTAAKDTTLLPAAAKLFGYHLDAVVSGTKSVKDGDTTKIETVTIFYFTDKDSAEKHSLMCRKKKMMIKTNPTPIGYLLLSPEV